MSVSIHKTVFKLHRAAQRTTAELFSFLLGGTECAVCGKSAAALPLCSGCRKKFFSIPAIDDGLCRVCGKTLVSENEVCMECRAARTLLHTDGIFPLFSYRLWNTRILSAWKRNDERIWSRFFAERLSIRLFDMKKRLGDFCLVPIPPRHGKIRGALSAAFPACVCIIDDVLTTGATLESAASALKAAGVKTVFAATLFTVD